MKKRIKKLLYSSLIAFVSMKISFNTEARLPKYMAQRATELLIEKSELLKEDIILVNMDYEVLMPIISAAVNEYITEEIPTDFFVKVLNGIRTPKAEVMDSSVKKLPNSDKVPQEQRVKQVQEVKDRFVAVLEHAQIVVPAEKTTEALSEAIKKAVIKKLISDKATNIVDFLYSTEKRQHLANWMKRRLPFKVYNQTISALENESYFVQLLGNYKDDEKFRTFVNQHFPCWTGTMTCFMLNNEAHKLLVQGNVADSCRIKLGNTVRAYKIVSILFTLEIIDDWNDIKQICKIDGETDDSSKLNIPPFGEIDPYDCVPVPNTAYEIENIYNGTYLLSTIRNLLCILKGQAPNFDNFNIKTEVMEYLKRFESSEQLTAIPGITNIDEQNRTEQMGRNFAGC